MPEAVRFGDLPAEAAAKWGDREAVRYLDQRVSFNELSSRVDQAARALLARGIRKGDAVGLWVTNRSEFIVALFAIQRIGAVAVPLNTRYREKDIGYVLALTQCRLLLVVERSGPVEYLQMLKSMLPGFNGNRFHPVDAFPHLRNIVVIGGSDDVAPLSWERFLEDSHQVSDQDLARAAASVRPDDMALIVLTSGTTGNPKGVMHDHSILRNARQRHHEWPLRSGDAVLGFLPMFHLFGMTEVIFGSLCTGVRQVVMDAWNAEQAVRLIESERITGLYGFETHYADLMRANETLKADLGSLRFGGLPAGMENSNTVALRAQKLLCPTATGFGMSETGCYICIATLDDTEEQRCTTSGRPMAGIEVRIADPETGATQPVGVEGELLVRGYTVMKGYFDDPEATGKVLDADGWLHSGDRAFQRSDGFLQFVGRYKEMLKIGGENVSPAAIEQEVSALVPTIQAIAAVGIPDERLGEVAVVYVVPKPGMSCTQTEVEARCRGKIASFKIPRHVITVERLPMTVSGKVQRVLLREQAVRELASSP